MPIVYEKTPDGKLKVIETKSIEAKFELKVLRKQKQMFKAKLDEIQVLIDEAVKLGADEGA